MAADDPNFSPSLWTIYKGGCFQRQKEDSSKWIKLDNNGKQIATYEELNSDDFDLLPVEIVLLDRANKILIKLDKKYVRESKLDPNKEVPVPLDTFDYVLPKNWDIAGQGFWDSQVSSACTNKENI